MSWWCDKCQMLNYSGDKCAGCGHVQEQKILKSYTAPKNKARIVNFNTLEDEKTITLNKNTVFIIAIVIIAISIAYLAITKYQERKEIEKLINTLGKFNDMAIEDINKLQKMTVENINNIKIPIIDFGKNQREMNEREAQRKRIEERNRQISIQNYERAKEIDKTNVLMQMNN